MNVTPLRSALLDLAEEEAEHVLGDAAARAAEARRRAAEGAEARIAQARTEAEEAAEQEADRLRARARRQGRSLVLAARRDVYDRLRSEAHTAALALRGSPPYERMVARLAESARARLGEEAIVEIDPSGEGGVRARGGHRRLDYSLPVLVERSLESLGPRLEALWE